jgi:hypothetical protein
MYLLILILLLLAFFVCLLFFKPMDVTLLLNTNQDQISIKLNWIESLLTAKVQINPGASVLSIFLFKNRIYSKPLHPKKQKKRNKLTFVDYLYSLSLQKMYASIYYGFKDPFDTGITSGILQFIEQTFQGVLIKQYPDFIPGKEYIIINAGAELNLGKTMIAMMNDKQKKIRSN